MQSITAFYLASFVTAISLSTLEVNSSFADQQRKPEITARQIEFFLTLAFGEDASAAQRRMVSGSDSARVRFNGASDKDKASLAKAIAEINSHAGRTFYVLADSGASVNVSIVGPEYYIDLVPSEAKNLFAHYRYRSDRNGQITSVALVMRSNLAGIEKLRTLRRHLARAAGLVSSSNFEKRSMFYRSGTEAYEFEPMDRAALRILGENAELRGKTMTEVRAALEARYLGTGTP